MHVYESSEKLFLEKFELAKQLTETVYVVCYVKPSNYYSVLFVCQSVLPCGGWSG